MLPLVLDLQGIRGAPDRAVTGKYADGKTNVLFVGRGAPNKRIEDVLHAFFHYQRFVNPDSRLIHVGSFAGTESYLALLYTRIKELGVRDLDFHGSIPDAQVRAWVSPRWWETASASRCAAATSMPMAMSTSPSAPPARAAPTVPRKAAR